MAKHVKKVKLVRSIIVDGEDQEKGSVHELPVGVAQRLIGEGSAEPHYEEGEEPDPAPTSVRVDPPTTQDPKATNGDPKVKGRK